MFVNTICIRANGIMNNNENRPNILERINLDIQEDFSKRHDQLFQNSSLISRLNTTFLRDGELYLYKRTRLIWGNDTWVNSLLITNTYDNDGNQLSRLYQNWSGNDWVNSSLSTLTYDTDENLYSVLYQNWSGNDWVNSSLSTSTYDAGGNRLSWLIQDWNGNDWVNDYQRFYTYDVDGNRLSTLRQHWENNIWVNSTLFTFTYDTDGNQLSELYQNWDGNDWVSFWQFFYTYNSDGNLISVLLQEWNSNTWVNLGLDTYTYDTNDNQLSMLGQYWNDSTWVNSTLFTSAYDTDGNQLSQLDQNWNDSTWVNLKLFTSTYDTDGNQLSELYQNWDGNDWINSTQWINTYTTSSPIFVEVEDQIINEDNSLTIELEVGSPLVPIGYSFFVFSDTNDVNVINDSNLVIINPTENWYGNTEITAIVFDENSQSDTITFVLIINSVNDTPEPFNVLYPTVTDTFSSHVDSNQDIGFTWGGCNDVDNDVEYSLTIFLEFFGNYYYDVYDNITDTTINISGNNLDDLLGGLNISETSLNWYVTANDEDYSVLSDTGEFVLSRSLLDVLDDSSIPTVFTLHQNYPNPFNPITTLRYDLPENSYVNVTVYDMLGRQVKKLINQTQDAGFKSVIWNATNDYGKPVSAGVYLYQIQAGEFLQTKKMVLLK